MNWGTNSGTSVFIAKEVWGSVVKAIFSYTIRPGFESTHRQLHLYLLFTAYIYIYTSKEKKEAGICPQNTLKPVARRLAQFGQLKNFKYEFNRPKISFIGTAHLKKWMNRDASSWWVGCVPVWRDAEVKKLPNCFQKLQKNIPNSFNINWSVSK